MNKYLVIEERFYKNHNIEISIDLILIKNEYDIELIKSAITKDENYKEGIEKLREYGILENHFEDITSIKIIEVINEIKLL